MAAAGVPKRGCSLLRPAGSMRSVAMAAMARDVVHSSVHMTPHIDTTPAAASAAERYGPPICRGKQSKPTRKPLERVIARSGRARLDKEGSGTPERCGRWEGSSDRPWLAYGESRQCTRPHVRACGERGCVRRKAVKSACVLRQRVPLAPGEAFREVWVGSSH
eukprot:1681055-Pleurochrysis_carterae.AAC.2